MKKTFLLFIIWVSLTNCLNTKPFRPEENTKEYNETLCFATYDENRYPKDTINTGPNDSLSLFENKWFSKHLNSMGELPIFSEKSKKDLRIVRYINLGTWSHPFIYRIEQVERKTVKVFKQTNGLGGYQPGRIIKEQDKIINSKIWDKIILKANNIDFWNMPTHDSKYILDGEMWILEILIDGKYHIVTRNSPDHSGDEKFTELCKLVSKYTVEK